jgi:fatty acid-binding protein DegV
VDCKNNERKALKDIRRKMQERKFERWRGETVGSIEAKPMEKCWESKNHLINDNRNPCHNHEKEPERKEETRDCSRNANAIE